MSDSQAKRTLPRMLISLLITLAIGAVWFYVSLPAINLHNTGFYSFVFILLLVYILVFMIILDVGTGDFATEIEPVSFDEIPMLDEASASVLGDRKLGELSDMVSQFDVSADYTQINYQGRPVRVAALEYGDFFKWFLNTKEGLPAYITVAFRPGSGGNAILSLRIFQPGPEPFPSVPLSHLYVQFRTPGD